MPYLRLCALALMILLPAAARAQCTAQLAKLLPTGNIGTTANLGRSVALSADGATALVGSFSDNTNVGAAYVFSQTGGVWTQQGPKLVATGGVGNAQFGIAVAISADGNTAIIGAQADNTNVGAAYVFTRTAGVWTQQGPKLIPTGNGGPGQFGTSIALSADGNTALIGANTNTSGVGAAYAFTRSGEAWTQQQKLSPTGGIGNGQFGRSVALSADGNTAIAGANADNASIGAAYVFTRAGAVWTAQGPKLVPTGGVGAGQFGRCVSLSPDGSTALIGAFADNVSIGAAYIFTRAAGVWTQLGSKLTPTGAIGNSQFGLCAAFGPGGNTVLIGANSDNANIGAAYLFARYGSIWLQQGQRLLPTGSVGAGQFGYSVSLSADGDTALIGAQTDNANIGAAYVFALNPTITFAQQPASTSVAAGFDATFTVGASSAVAVTYQWRRNGVNLVDGPSSTTAIISGATTATLTLASVAAADNAAAIDCIVSTTCGTATSAPAVLTVHSGCGTADFDGDGDIGTDQDIEAFFRVLAGGTC